MIDLRGQRVTVMGLGHFGGGVGVVRHLLKQGALVTVTDLQSAEQLAGSLAQIDVAQLAGLVLGEHRDELFTQTDLVVVSPAVKPGNRYVQLALEAGVAVTSEIALFWQNCAAKKIAVTGSTGKSTVASLIHHLLQAGGKRVHLGGNIGISLLPMVDQLTADDWVVLELSSFQLAALDALQPRPDIAVVTNFFPNHLDWHGTVEAYQEAKQTICSYQTKDETVVLNADDLEIPLWPTDGTVIWYGKECWRDRPGVVVEENHLVVRNQAGGWQIEMADLSPALRSPHGLMNAAAALAVAVVKLEIPIEQLAGPLLNFPGLPHRLQTVADIQGRTFINDSKATTPEATIAALNSMQSPVLLIAGGKDKEVDLSALADAIQGAVKGVAFIGDTAETLEKLTTKQFWIASAKEKRPRRAGENVAPGWIHIADSLHDALHWAWSESESGDAILLSPGCASHAEFVNYEQRGDRFVELIQTLTSLEADA